MLRVPSLQQHHVVLFIFYIFHLLKHKNKKYKFKKIMLHQSEPENCTTNINIFYRYQITFIAFFIHFCF